MSTVKLYSYWRSSSSQRIRIILALKGIKYEYVSVHLLKNGGEQRTEEYLSLNPMKQIPALVIDGHIITQSMAIAEYLDEKYPKPKIFPEDLVQKTKVREICELINSGIQPMQNLSTIQQLEQDRRQPWCEKHIHSGFTALEKHLKKTAGKYCMGDQITAADAFLAPQIYHAIRWKVNMDDFPIISRIGACLDKEEAFIQAHPDKQPDCPTNSG